MNSIRSETKESHPGFILQKWSQPAACGKYRCGPRLRPVANVEPVPDCGVRRETPLQIRRRGRENHDKMPQAGSTRGRCYQIIVGDNLLRKNDTNVKATSHSTTFRCVPCVKIKDTDDVLPVKEGPQIP